MKNYILSDKGNTLILVLGVAIVITLLAIPLVNMMNTGFVQAQTDIRKEQAREYAESGVRIMRKLLKLTADPSNIPEQNRRLVESLSDQVKDMIPNTELEVKYVPGKDEPDRVNITSHSGTGSLQRSKTTPLIILRFPKSSGAGGGHPGPTENSTGEEFYFKHAVTINNSDLQKHFKVCGNEQPDKSFFDNTLISGKSENTPENIAKFKQEFTSYVDYYLGNRFSTRMNQRPVPPATVPTISNGGSWPFGDNANGTHTGNIKVAGDISANSIKNVEIRGDVWSGGNINLTSNVGSLVIKGNLYVTKNLTIASSKTIEVTGDIIVGGKLQTGISTDNLKVGGNLIAGQYSGGQIERVQISGSFIVNGDVYIPSTLVDWHINGHISVAGTFQTGKITSLEVGQNIFAVNGISFSDANDKVKVGGSLLSTGTIAFIKTIKDVQIGEDIISKTKIDFTGITLMKVGGSVVSSGDIRFPGNVNQLYISGDLLTMANMNFENPIETKLEVTGIMGALKDMRFFNHIKDAQLGGFYVGGSTGIQPWTSGGICIDFKKKSAGSGSGIGIEFGS